LSDDAFCSVSAIEARRSIALPLRFATKVSHSRLFKNSILKRLFNFRF